jgi:chromosome segregation ATPase
LLLAQLTQWKSTLESETIKHNETVKKLNETEENNLTLEQQLIIKNNDMDKIKNLCKEKNDKNRVLLFDLNKVKRENSESYRRLENEYNKSKKDYELIKRELSQAETLCVNLQSQLKQTKQNKRISESLISTSEASNVKQNKYNDEKLIPAITNPLVFSACSMNSILQTCE